MKQLIRVESDSIHVEGMLDIPENPEGIVLFAHGSGSSRLSPRNNFVAGVLRKAGLGTLLMDLLTAKEDQDYQHRFDIKLLTKRLDDAVDWLLQHEPTRSARIGLFGASTGAAAALQVAVARGSEIAAIVSRGGRPDLAGREVLERVVSPTLLIVGGDDDVVIDLNRRALAELHCERRMDIIPGATHLFEEPGKLEAVAEIARDWFVQHLLQLRHDSMGDRRPGSASMSSGAGFPG